MTAGIKVAQTLRRNRKITRTTNPMLSSSVNCTSLTEARMVWMRSDRTDTLMVGGIDASSCGSNALIRSTVAITLAPGCRMIGMMIARCPFIQPPSRSFSGPETAWPMSRTRTGEPFW